MKKIAIIGYKGYVGSAMVGLFKDHYGLVKHDKDDGNKNEVNACDLGVVCVPTPMNDDGSCDTSIVEEILGWLDTPVIWLRSTVPPGTSDYLAQKYDKRIVFSPEYIGEGKYWQPYKFNKDEKEASWFVLGGHTEDTIYLLDLLVPITGPTKRYIKMSRIEAELVKYMENIYFATKVTFANEMRRICEAFGVDYWTVRDGWAADPRVDPMHTACFKERPGFDGKCLPKDLNALIMASIAVGYRPEFFEDIWKANKRFRGDE
jgi:nucleotide sugar dehydrogenase